MGQLFDLVELVDLVVYYEFLIKTFNPTKQTTIQPGNLATWQPGNLATWQPGNLATWQPGATQQAFQVSKASMITNQAEAEKAVKTYYDKLTGMLKSMIVLYGKHWCGYCQAAKKMLQDSNVASIYVEFGQPSDAVLPEHTAILEKASSVPIVMLGSKLLGGSEELQQYIQQQNEML